MKSIFWFLILVLIPVVYSADGEVDEENAYVVLEDDPMMTLDDFVDDGLDEFISLVKNKNCLKPHFQRLTEYLSKTIGYNIKLSSKLNEFINSVEELKNESFIKSKIVPDKFTISKEYKQYVYNAIKWLEKRIDIFKNNNMEPFKAMVDAHTNLKTAFQLIEWYDQMFDYCIDSLNELIDGLNEPNKTAREKTMRNIMKKSVKCLVPLKKNDGVSIVLENTKNATIQSERLVRRTFDSCLRTAYNSIESIDS